MLIYHPRCDTYHTSFRILSIIKLLENQPVELPKLRIIDFFFVFPHLLGEVRLPLGARFSHLKSLSKRLSIPYEKLPDKKRLFSEMGDYQIQASHILRAKLILVETEGLISAGQRFFDDAITVLLNQHRFVNEEFYKRLVERLFEIPLQGSNGLKARTGLMEYRYDPV